MRLLFIILICLNLQSCTVTHNININREVVPLYHETDTINYGN